MGQLGPACAPPQHRRITPGPRSLCPGELGQAERVQWVVTAVRISDRSPPPPPPFPFRGADLSPGSGPAVIRPQRWWMDQGALRVTPAPSPSALTGKLCQGRAPGLLFHGSSKDREHPCLPCGRGSLLWQNPQGRHWGRAGFSAASRPDHLPPPGRPSVSAWEWSPRATQGRAWITAPPSQFPTCIWLLNYLPLKGVLGFPGGSVGRESACSAGDSGSITGWEDPLGEGNGNPLQYSCLGNPTDRGA